jgi:hypothetical protein
MSSALRHLRIELVSGGEVWGDLHYHIDTVEKGEPSKVVDEVG